MYIRFNILQLFLNQLFNYNMQNLPSKFRQNLILNKLSSNSNF